MSGCSKYQQIAKGNGKQGFLNVDFDRKLKKNIEEGTKTLEKVLIRVTKWTSELNLVCVQIQLK